MSLSLQRRRNSSTRNFASGFSGCGDLVESWGGAAGGAQPQRGQLLHRHAIPPNCHSPEIRCVPAFGRQSIEISYQKTGILLEETRAMCRLDE